MTKIKLNDVEVDAGTISALPDDVKDALRAALDKPKVRGYWEPRDDGDIYFEYSGLNESEKEFLETSSMGNVGPYLSEKLESGNVFPSNEKALRKHWHSKFEHQLRKFAYELSVGPEGNGRVDWGNPWQYKYFLEYSHMTESVVERHMKQVCIAGVIYCTHEDFFAEAFRKFGEADIKKFLTMDIDELYLED